MDPIVMTYLLVVAGILGLVMGSFINCWAWRSMHGESILKGRSHCPSCNHDLGARDLVPVISWLASGRKCRYCGQPISARYPITELICAAVYVAIVAKYGLSLETIELILFASVLLFLSLTDIDDYTIPNGCIIVALVIRAVYLTISVAMGNMTLDDVIYYVLSGLGMGIVLVVIILVADKVFGRESMGGGDLKLYAVAGFYFGWQQGLLLVILSCIIGIVVALLGMRGKGQLSESDQQDTEYGEGVIGRPFPFGPSIAVACIIVMLVGDSFITWYLGLL